MGGGWWKLTADSGTGSRMADHGRLTEQERKTLGKHFRSIGDGELMRVLRKLCGVAGLDELMPEGASGLLGLLDQDLLKAVIPGKRSWMLRRTCRWLRERMREQETVIRLTRETVLERLERVNGLCVIAGLDLGLRGLGAKGAGRCRLSHHSTFEVMRSEMKGQGGWRQCWGQ